MGTTIDERVVQMRFDNKQFEAGAQQSMNTLDRFKAKLNFSGISQKANAELSNVGTVTEQVGIKFDAMAVVAMTALQRITNAAMDAGKNILKSLTIQPVSSGMSEYELKLNSIQSILANTKRHGSTLEDVGRALDDLNHYADKTIYNFGQMTQAIGMFTTAGVNLETSTSAVKGIANLAAFVGAPAQDATRAMFQLSQALSTGTVRLQDWMSIEHTAGMAGVEFQDRLKATARILGENVDAAIQKNGNFRESLKEGWLTTEVLTETLKQFAGEVDEIYLKQQGWSDAQIASIMELGKTATESATVVKSFSQLLDTLAEAAQSGWAESWELIIGDLEEAKQLWTGVSQAIGGFIDGISEGRNKILRGWKELGGRTVLIDAIAIAFQNVADVVNGLAQAFRRVFPATTAQQLYNVTVSFKELVGSMKLSEDAIFTLQEAFKALLLPVQLAWQGLRIGAVVIRGLIPIMFRFVDSVLSLPSNLDKVGNAMRKVFGDERYEKMANAWNQAVNNLRTGFSKLVTNAGELLKNLRTLGSAKLGEAFDRLREAIRPLTDWVLDRVVDGFTALMSLDFTQIVSWAEDGFTMVIDGLVSIVNWATNGVNAVIDFFRSFKDKSPQEVFTDIGNGFKNMGQRVAEFFRGLGEWDVVRTLTGFFRKLSSAVVEFVSQLTPAKILVFGFGVALTTMMFNLSKAINAVTGVFQGIGGIFEAIKARLKPSKITQLAVAIGVLAASLTILSLVDSSKLITASIALGALMVVLLGMVAGMAAIEKFLLKGDAFGKGMTQLAAGMMVIAAAVLVLSSAMAVLSSIGDPGAIVVPLIMVMGTMVGLAAAMAFLAKRAPELSKNAMTLVAFAVAIKMVANSLGGLIGYDLADIAVGLITLVTVMGALSLLALSMKNVKFGNAMGLTVMILDMVLLMKVIKSLSDLDPEQIARGVIGYMGVILALIPLIVMIKVAGKDALKISVSLMSLVAAVILLKFAIEQIAQLSLGQVLKGTLAISALIAMFGVLTMMSKMSILQNGTAKMGSNFLAVGAAILLLSVAIDYLGGMNLKKVAQGTAIVLVLMAMFVLVEKASKQAEKAHKSIIAMGVVVGLLMASIALLTLIPFNEAMRSAVIMGTLLLAFGAAMKLSSKMNVNVKSIVFMIAFIIEVLNVVRLLNAMPLNEGLMTKVAALTVVMVAITEMNKRVKARTGDFMNLLKALGVMGIMMLEVTGVIALINAIPLNDGLVTKTAALIAVLAAITTLQKQIKPSTAKASNLLKPIAMMALLLTEAVAVLAVVNAIPINDGLLTKVLALDAVMAGMAVLMASMTLLSNSSMGWGTVGQVLVLMLGLLVEAAAVIAFLNWLEIAPGLMEKVAAMSVLLIAMSGVVAIISTFSAGLIALAAGGVPMAISAILTIDIFIADLVLIILAIGGVFELLSPWLDNALTKAEDVIPRIGGVIGGFVGAVVGGFVEFASAGLATGIVNIGQALSDFAEAIGPFLSTMGNVPEGAIDGATQLAGVILALTGATFLDGLLSFLPFAKKTTLVDIGKQLAEMGPHFAEFANSMDGIPIEETKAAAAALDALAGVLVAIPLEGGMWGAIVGNKNLGSFGEGLKTFTEGLSGYFKVIKDSGITADVVDVTSYACDALTKFANDIPSAGGAIQEFFGEKNMADFGRDLIYFGGRLVTFFKIITGDPSMPGSGKVDFNTVTACANAGKALADFADALPAEGGFIQDIVGTKSISQFGQDLYDFGWGLARFFNLFSGKYGAKIDQTVVDSAVNAGTALAGLQGALGNSGGLIGDIFGDQDLGDFGTQLGTFGEGISNFFLAIRDSGLSNTEIETANLALQQVGSLARIAVSAQITPGALTSFTDYVDDLGSNLLTYYEYIKGIDFTKVNGSAYALRSLASVSEAFTAGEESMTSSIKMVFEGLKTAIKETMAIDDTNRSAIFYGFGSAMVLSLLAGIMAEYDENDDTIDTYAKTIITAYNKALAIENGKSDEAHRIGGYFIEGIIEGMNEKSPEANQAAIAIAKGLVTVMENTLEIESPSKVTRDRIGRFIIQGIAEGITSDMSAEEAAAKKAENIVNAFRSELEKYSLDMTTFGLEFDLWTGMNPAATIQETNQRNVDLMTKKLQAQAERVDLANAQYQATLKALGEQAEETQEAYNAYIQEQIDMISLANELITARRDLLTAGPHDLDTADLEYTLWEKLHTTATEQEVAQKQIELLNKQLENHAYNVAYANANYQKLLETLGEQAQGTRDAYQQYLQAQIDMASAAAEFIELQGGGNGSDNRTQFERWESYVNWVDQKVDETGRTMQQTLLDAGFTLEQVQKEAQRQSGWYPTNAITSVEGVMNQYLEKVKDSIGDITSMAGQTAVDVMNQFMSQTTSALSQTGQVDVIIQNAVQTAGKAGQAMSANMATSTANGMPQVTDAVANELSKIPGISESIGEESGQAFVNGYMSNTTLDQWHDALGNWGSAGEQKAKEFLERINGQSASNARSMEEYGYEMSMSTNVGMIEGFDDSTKPITSATTALMEIASSTAADTGYQGMVRAGTYAATGFVQGMNAKLQSVKMSASGMAQMAVNTTNASLGIKSPSRVFYKIGKYIDQGLANGVLDEFKIVGDALSIITKKAQDVGNSWSSTVSPVHWISQVDVRKLDEFYDTVLQWDGQGNLVPLGYSDTGVGGKWIKVDKAVAQAVRAGDAVLTQKALEAAKSTAEHGYARLDRYDEMETTGFDDIPKYERANYTFNQYNSSPKSLSTSEIYRKTQTQFRQAARELMSPVKPTTAPYRKV